MTLPDFVRDYLAGGNGLLGQSGMIRPRHAPKNIRLTEDGRYIAWTMPGDATESVDPSGLLDEFVRLITAEDVLRFARKFGPLLLCNHGAPITHSWLPSDPFGISTIGSIDSDTGACDFGVGTEDQLFGPHESLVQEWIAGTSKVPVDEPWKVDMWLKEPVDVWLRLVSKVRAFLRLISDVANGFSDRPEDWQELGLTHDFRRLDRDHPDYLDQQIRKNLLLRDFALIWLNLSEVSLTYGFTADNEPNLGWMTFSPWGQLGLQMIAVHTRAHDLLICMYCDQPFTAGRRRKRTERIVCRDSACRRRHASDRKRTQRNRNGEK